MAITTNAIANSFKKELLEGKHDFTASTGSVFKLAMYNFKCSNFRKIYNIIHNWF
jgi:hypothetical protein